MNNRRLKEATKHMDRGEYRDAYAKAFKLLCEEKTIDLPELAILFDIVSYACEVFRQEGSESITEDDQKHLLSVLQKYDDYIASHTSMFFTLSLLAYEREDYALCSQLMEKLFAIVDSDVVEYKSEWLTSLELWIDSLCWQSRFDEALAAAEKWMSLANSELNENDIFTAQIYKKMGDIYFAQNKTELAETQYKRCLELHQNESCLIGSDAQSAADSYIRLLERLNRHGDADEVRAQIGIEKN